MAKATDLVCGMLVETDSAPAKFTFQNETYYFCSTECRDRFKEDPARYTSQENRDRLAASLHNPRMATPRFGSAGSGGAEFESVPEMDKRGVD